MAVTLVAACSDDGGSAEELCRALRDDPSITNAFEGFDPTDVPRALDQLRQARVTLGELRDAAPSEVRDELTVEIDYVQAMIDGLSDVEDGDAADAVIVVQQVTIDHPDVADAAAELSAYAEASCA